MPASTPSREKLPSSCPTCEGIVDLPQTGPSEGFVCPTCRQHVWFLKKLVGEVVVLTFLSGTARNEESLRRLDEIRAAAGAAKGLILELSRLRFVSSLFLGMLVVLHRRMGAAHGSLKLCGLQRETRDVLRVTKLDRVFAIYDDETSALASFTR